MCSIIKDGFFSPFSTNLRGMKNEKWCRNYLLNEMLTMTVVLVSVCASLGSCFDFSFWYSSVTCGTDLKRCYSVCGSGSGRSGVYSSADSTTSDMCAHTHQRTCNLQCASSFNNNHTKKKENHTKPSETLYCSTWQHRLVTRLNFRQTHEKQYKSKLWQMKKLADSTDWTTEVSLWFYLSCFPTF